MDATKGTHTSPTWLRLGLAVAVALGLAPASGSGAATGDTNAACTIEVTMFLKPGLLVTETTGVVNSNGQGLLDCRGTVNGRAITGPGAIEVSGHYRGTCAENSASGGLRVKLPTADGMVSAEGTWVAENLGVLGPFRVFIRSIGDGTGAFTWIQGNGDCVATAVTEVDATASATILG